MICLLALLGLCTDHCLSLVKWHRNFNKHLKKKIKCWLNCSTNERYCLCISVWLPLDPEWTEEVSSPTGSILASYRSENLDILGSSWPCPNLASPFLQFHLPLPFIFQNDFFSPYHLSSSFLKILSQMLILPSSAISQLKCHLPLQKPSLIAPDFHITVSLWARLLSQTGWDYIWKFHMWEMLDDSLLLEW